MYPECIATCPKARILLLLAAKKAVWFKEEGVAGNAGECPRRPHLSPSVPQPLSLNRTTAAPRRGAVSGPGAGSGGAHESEAHAGGVAPRATAESRRLGRE